MRIGGSFNFPQLPQQLSQRQPVAPTSGSNDSSSTNSKSSQISPKDAAAPLVDFAAEFAKTRTGQSAGTESFYSTDRSLSLKGQSAMDTYVTNAGFQFGAGQAEWVGVDTYA